MSYSNLSEYYSFPLKYNLIGIWLMEVKSMGRIENKNYNGDGIDTIIHVKKKIMLFLRYLDLRGNSL